MEYSDESLIPEGDEVFCIGEYEEKEWRLFPNWLSIRSDYSDYDYIYDTDEYWKTKFSTPSSHDYARIYFENCGNETVKIYLKVDGQKTLGPYKVRPDESIERGLIRCANKSFTFVVQSVNGKTIRGKYGWRISEYRLNRKGNRYSNKAEDNH